MTGNDFMTEKRKLHSGNMTLGTTCEEMHLYEKPYTEVKIFCLQTEASGKDI